MVSGMPLCHNVKRKKNILFIVGILFLFLQYVVEMHI